MPTIFWKKKVQSSTSFESTFSEENLKALGFRRVLGTAVHEEESLWDCSQPIVVRTRKIATVGSSNTKEGNAKVKTQESLVEKPSNNSTRMSNFVNNEQKNETLIDQSIEKQSQLDKLMKLSYNEQNNSSSIRENKLENISETSQKNKSIRKSILNKEQQTSDTLMKLSVAFPDKLFDLKLVNKSQQTSDVLLNSYKPQNNIKNIDFTNKIDPNHSNNQKKSIIFNKNKIIDKNKEYIIKIDDMAIENKTASNHMNELQQKNKHSETWSEMLAKITNNKKINKKCIEKNIYQKKHIKHLQIIPTVESQLCSDTLRLSVIKLAVQNLFKSVNCLKELWKCSPNLIDSQIDCALNLLIDRLKWLKKDTEFTNGTCDQLYILIEAYDNYRTQYYKLKKKLNRKKNV